MSTIRLIISGLAIVSAFSIGVLTKNFSVLHVPTTNYLKLSEPLLLNADSETKYFHMLPPGTAMYKDYTAPEGFTRYIVYINVKGEFQAESIVSEKRNMVDPIWGYTVRKEEVTQLMAETPISKDDLARILKARKITREELAQIVREWKE